MIKMVNQRLRERPSGLRDFFDVARHGSPRRSLGFQQAACFQLGERALDEVLMLKDNTVFLHQGVDELREAHGCSVDEYFREVFRA